MKKYIHASGLEVLIIVVALAGIIIFPAACTLSTTQKTSQNTSSASTSSSNMSGTENQLAQQLFNQINSDRATQGLPAYTWNETLVKGAYQHNVTMTTTGCGLAHQCPSEPTPCERVTNEGLTWQTCGENIGYT